MQCTKCERGMKSYGLQDEECVTCMRAFFYGQSDDFKQAQYERFCNNGAVFSIVLFTVVPVLCIGVALILCCCARGSDIHNNEFICEDQTVKYGDKKRPRKQTGYVKQVT